MPSIRRACAAASHVATATLQVLVSAGSSARHAHHVRRTGPANTHTTLPTHTQPATPATGPPSPIIHMDAIPHDSRHVPGQSGARSARHSVLHTSADRGSTTVWWQAAWRTGDMEVELRVCVCVCVCVTNDLLPTTARHPAITQTHTHTHDQDHQAPPPLQNTRPLRSSYTQHTTHNMDMNRRGARDHTLAVARAGAPRAPTRPLQSSARPTQRPRPTAPNCCPAKPPPPNTSAQHTRPIHLTPPAATGPTGFRVPALVSTCPRLRPLARRPAVPHNIRARHPRPARTRFVLSCES